MMSYEQSAPILQQPIIELEVSREFQLMAERNGFTTLSDLLQIPMHEIPLLPDSGYRMLVELCQLLENNGLSSLIKD